MGLVGLARKTIDDNTDATPDEDGLRAWGAAASRPGSPAGRPR